MCRATWESIWRNRHPRRHGDGWILQGARRHRRRDVRRVAARPQRHGMAVDSETYINIVDRKKEIIISGGENISSIEVERAICAHPAVLESAVVAMPDTQWGEVPAAYVALKPGEGIFPSATWPISPAGPSSPSSKCRIASRCAPSRCLKPALERYSSGNFAKFSGELAKSAASRDSALQHRNVSRGTAIVRS